MANPLSEFASAVKGRMEPSGGLVRKLSAPAGASVIDNITEMMLGGDAARAQLRAAWEGMGNQEKQRFVLQLAEKFPNQQGNVGMSPEGQFIVDFLQGRAEVSPERLEAINAAAREADLGSRTVTTDLPGNSGAAGTPNPAQLVEPNLEPSPSGGFEFDPDEMLNSTRPNNPLRKQFEGGDLLNRISNKEPLRGPKMETVLEVIDTPEGKRRVPVRKPVEGTGRFDDAAASGLMSHGTGGRPREVSDYTAALGNTSPQKKYDQDIVSFLQSGGKKGSRDWLMGRGSLWAQAGGADAPADPRMAFSSPREFAEFLASRVNPEVLLAQDPGINASQIRDAKSVITGEQGKRFANSEAPLNANQAERAVRESLPDVPRTGQQQLTRPMSRLVDELEALAAERFGDQWGGQFKKLQSEAGGLGDLTGTVPESRLPEGFGEGPISPQQQFEAGRNPTPAEMQLNRNSPDADRVVESPHFDQNQAAINKRINDYRDELLTQGDMTPGEIEEAVDDLRRSLGSEPSGRWLEQGEPAKAPSQRDIADMRSAKWDAQIEGAVSEFGPGLGVEGSPRSPQQIQAEMDSLYYMGLSPDEIDARMAELSKEMRASRRIAPHIRRAISTVNGLLSETKKAAKAGDGKRFDVILQQYPEIVKNLNESDKAKLQDNKNLLDEMQRARADVSKEAAKTGQLDDSRADPKPGPDEAATPRDQADGPDMEEAAPESRVPDEEPKAKDPEGKPTEEQPKGEPEEVEAKVEEAPKPKDSEPVDAKVKEDPPKKKGLLRRAGNFAKEHPLVTAGAALGGAALLMNRSGDPNSMGKVTPTADEDENANNLVNAVLNQPTDIGEESETAIIRRMAEERKARIAATAKRTGEFTVNRNTGTHKNWIR